MESKFHIGDHVHLRGYARGSGTGVVTEIEEGCKGYCGPYTAVYVEYDKPIPDRWPNQHRVFRRGKHAEDRLELIDSLSGIVL